MIVYAGDGKKRLFPSDPSDNVKKVEAVKKILLAAGDNPGLLHILPLFRALEASEAYTPVLACPGIPAGEPAGEDLPALFGIADGIARVGSNSGSPVGRIAFAMTGFEPLMAEHGPDLVIVAGDDDISLAAALASAKLGLPFGRIAAGMRSYNRAAPGEVNRRLIDAVADMFFVSEHSGAYNLVGEGVDEERIFFVGNMAIDSLAALIERANASTVLGGLGFEPKTYAMVSLQNAAALDSAEALDRLARLVSAIAEKHSVLVLRNAGVEAVMEEHGRKGMLEAIGGVQVRPPFGYVDFLRVVKDALFILTDAEGVQDESTVMRVPCITMLAETPSPATIEIGTNILAGVNEEDILRRIGEVAKGKPAKHAKIPEKWDGAASQRIVEVLDRVLAE